MKANTQENDSYSRIIKKRVIAYILDIEDMRMYPIVNIDNGPERNAIELPVIRSPSSVCHVVPGGGDVVEIEIFRGRHHPARIVRIVHGDEQQCRVATMEASLG